MLLFSSTLGNWNGSNASIISILEIGHISFLDSCLSWVIIFAIYPKAFKKHQRHQTQFLDLILSVIYRQISWDGLGCLRENPTRYVNSKLISSILQSCRFYCHVPLWYIFFICWTKMTKSNSADLTCFMTRRVNIQYFLFIFNSNS